MTTETKPQKQSLWGSLKNAVWVDSTPAQNVQPETPVVELPQTSGEPASLDMGVVGANTNDLFVRLDSDPRAESLTKFLSTLASLESFIPDETTRYRAALTASGTSKDELLSQAGLYAEIFKQVNDEFIANKINPMRDKIQLQVDRVADETAKIEDLKTKLQWAEDELARAQSSIAEMQAEITHDTSALTEAQKAVQTNRETLAKKIAIFLE